MIIVLFWIKAMEQEMFFFKMMRNNITQYSCTRLHSLERERRGLVRQHQDTKADIAHPGSGQWSPLKKKIIEQIRDKVHYIMKSSFQKQIFIMLTGK